MLFLKCQTHLDKELNFCQMQLAHRAVKGHSAEAAGEQYPLSRVALSGG